METADQRTRRVLVAHGMPEGLLPGGIVEADIGEDGSFAVRLPKRVVRTHGGYKVRFDTAIRGQLAAGRVSRLEGVSAKQLMWFPVTAIDAEGSALIFTVGPGVRRRLSVSDFP